MEKLGSLACTQDEAAAFFGVTRQTMNTRLKQPEYLDAWERGQGKGKVSLRRAQFRLADKNATMAIFLGKQILSQRDKTEHEISGKDGGPIMLWGSRSE